MMSYQYSVLSKPLFECVKMWVLWNSEFSKSKVMIRIWNSLFEQGNLRSCKSSLFTSFISRVTKMLGLYVIWQILSL